MFFKSSVALIIKYSSEKKIENLHINTSIKDIYKKYTKLFQNPTRHLLDPMVEFIPVYPETLETPYQYVEIVKKVVCY